MNPQKIELLKPPVISIFVRNISCGSSEWFLTDFQKYFKRIGIIISYGSSEWFLTDCQKYCPRHIISKYLQNQFLGLHSTPCVLCITSNQKVFARDIVSSSSIKPTLVLLEMTVYNDYEKEGGGWGGWGKSESFHSFAFKFYSC